MMPLAPPASRREDRKSMTVINQRTGERFAGIDQIVLGMGRNKAQMVFTIGSIAILTKRRGCVLSLCRGAGQCAKEHAIGRDARLSRRPSELCRGWLSTGLLMEIRLPVTSIYDPNLEGWIR